MGTSADLDHRGQAAPAGAQPAVGPEGGAVAGGAVRADRDTVGRQARPEQPSGGWRPSGPHGTGPCGDGMDERLRVAPRPARRPAGTSPWVSKQHREIPGPMAAIRSPGRQPKSRIMASAALAAMPRAVPRHPAWTAAATFFLGSHSSTGIQSAEKTVRHRPGVRVTRPSASTMPARPGRGVRRPR